MINKLLFHIFNIFKDTFLSKDWVHRDSDLVPSITKYCHKHIQSVLSPTPQKKDLRLNWVSVSLWQQFFCWRHTMHRKGTKRKQKNDILFCWGTSLEENQAECGAHLWPFALFCVVWCLIPGAQHSLCGFWAGVHHYHLTEEATVKQLQSHCPSPHIISPFTLLS